MINKTIQSLAQAVELIHARAIILSNRFIHCGFPDELLAPLHDKNLTIVAYKSSIGDIRLQPYCTK